MIHPSTRLRRAINLRSLPLVQRIISSNSDLPELVQNPDLEDNGNTSLHLAAKLGLVEIAEFLIVQGHESRGYTRTLDGKTPLMLCAEAGPDDDNDPIIAARVVVGKLLIDRFPEAIGIKDHDGMNAFSIACRYGTNSLLTILLGLQSTKAAVELSGAKLNPVMADATPFLSMRDNIGNTPVHYASAYGQLKTLRLLLMAGGDPLTRNAAGWTAIDYSASVAAEVYLRNLVKEQGVRRVEEGQDQEDRRRRNLGAFTSTRKGAVRLVQSDDGSGSDDTESGAEERRGRARTAT